MSEALWRAITAASPKNGNGWSVDKTESWIGEHERRDEFIREFSFAVPNRSAIQGIKKFTGKRSLLEVGAGTGLWARLLADTGLTVTAIDNHGTKDYRSKFQVGRYFPIGRCSARKAVSLYLDHLALLLCWPDYATRMAADALAAFQGDRLIYIGEGEGGCTGDERFHKMLHSWRRVARIGIPQWPGIHDEVMLYEPGATTC